MTPERGAIGIVLDRPRILFYDSAATCYLVERYGFRFASELYTVTEAAGAEPEFKLKSRDALQFFLFVGLDRDAREHGETLTLERVDDFIRPWNVAKLFRAVLQGLTGATFVPPVKAGHDAADGAKASPPATRKPSRKSPAKKNTSTLKTRSGLRLQR